MREEVENNRSRIVEYLKKHGKASAADLEHALSLSKGKVWYALHQSLRPKRIPFYLFIQKQNSEWQLATGAIFPKIKKTDHKKALIGIQLKIVNLEKQIKELRIVENFHLRSMNMLVISRKKNEVIRISDNISITIVDIIGEKVRLGINAPKNIPVHREEVYEAIQRENKGIQK